MEDLQKTRLRSGSAETVSISRLFVMSQELELVQSTASRGERALETCKPPHKTVP